MKTRFAVMIAAMAIALAGAACGGDGDSDGDDPGSSGGDAGNGGATAAPGGGSSSGGGTSGGSGGSGGSVGAAGTPAAPTPIGPVAVNTIQIGDDTWTRTLPMTTGQCFLFEDDGSLPTSAVSWGPLDGDHEIRFSATQNQDGTFEAEVRDDDRIFWIAGPRSPGVDDLAIELDFDTLTITGEGTFSSLLGDVRAGSFQIQCEPEDQ